MPNLAPRLALAAALLAVVAGRGAAQGAQAAPPLGAWTGASLCLQGRPACHDERVVYRVERAGDADSAGVALRVSMNKIVRGAEEAMVVLACRWTSAEDELLCPMPPQYAKGQWRFRRVGGELVGGLWLDGRGQVRTVRVQASTAPAP